jgi:hydroxypyruvate reductase
VSKDRVERLRRNLLQVYQAALARVDGQAVVRAALQGWQGSGELALVAIGKAAQAMAMGARDALGERIVEGLVISKQGHLDQRFLERAVWQGLEGGHPLPDGRSLAAGQALLGFLEQQPAGRPLLLLISGGASSLVEVLRDGVGLEDLQRANAWLLGSGLPIGEINRVRRRLSAIKGGGLLRCVEGHPLEVLLISDVPGDDPAIIGSGLLVPPAMPDEDLHGLPLPEWLADLLGALPEQVVAESGAACRVVANLDQACDAAEAAARGLGYPVFRSPVLLSGGAAEAGVQLARELMAGPPGLYVWGGETTVVLPPEPGQGGRNQHLALAAALELAGRDNICLLAAGTDGSDGPTEDAGGLVDGGTLARAGLDGLDGQDCLRRADAGTLLAAAGDLLHAGPTGSNVMDLVLGLKWGEPGV